MSLVRPHRKKFDEHQKLKKTHEEKCEEPLDSSESEAESVDHKRHWDGEHSSSRQPTLSLDNLIVALRNFSESELQMPLVGPKRNSQLEPYAHKKFKKRFIPLDQLVF